MVWVGIVPTQITSIGVSFSEADQRILVGGGAAVVLYFFVTFWLQSSADGLTRKVAWSDVVETFKSAGLQEGFQEARWSWGMDYYFPRVLGEITLASCSLNAFGIGGPATATWLIQ